MKRLSFAELFIAIIAALVLVTAACSQSRSNRIYRPCPSAASLARVEVQADGDVNLVPCSGRAVLVNDIATSSLFTVTGSSRTNYFPFFSTETNLAKSPFLWNGTNYLFNNAAENSEFTLNFLPNTTTGRFRVGDFTTTPTTFLDVNQSAAAIALNAPLVEINSASAAAYLTVSSAAPEIRLGGSPTGDMITLLPSINALTIGGTLQSPFVFLKTITAGGVTGNQTIDRPSGTVNFAAATGTGGITVNNSFVTANSIVMAIARTNDATCSVKSAVPAAGSFVIRMTANCTAETSVGFHVLN